MIYVLKNDKLTVKISSFGAVLTSVVGADGCEYMWQGDERYWEDTAPWLFPICGRLPSGRYTYGGKTFAMDCHGFAQASEFEASEVSDTALTLSLTANEQTKKQYPFDFVFAITYTLSDTRLNCRLSVENKGTELLPATFGGHPGFNIPLDGESDFSDWRLEFDKPCYPDSVIFTDALQDSGKRVAYPLENSRRFPLSHDLFRIDGVFLTGMAQSVTLCSDKSARRVTVTYGDAPYLGIWSSDNDGPFVCIEPWWGMATQEGSVALEEKCNMFRLPAGASHAADIIIDFQ